MTRFLFLILLNCFSNGASVRYHKNLEWPSKASSQVQGVAYLISLENGSLRWVVLVFHRFTCVHSKESYNWCMEISLDISKFKVSKHASFQLVGEEIMKFCGLKKFPIMLYMNFSPEIVEKAFRIAEKKGIKSSKYIWGIARNLK